MPSALRSLFKSRTNATSTSHPSDTVAPPSGSVTVIGSPPATMPDRVSRVDVIQSDEIARSPASSSPSPMRSAALNALRLALQHLGAAPVPGLSVATGAVLSIIDGVQNMAKAEKESKKLTKRIETLSYLVNNVGQVGGSQGIIDRLVEELHDLASDMAKSSKANKLEAFFNSNDDVSTFDSHNDTLSDIISDLTFALATATKRDTSQIRKDIEEALKQRQATEGSENTAPGRMETTMTDNEINHITGDLDTGNTVTSGASMVREIRGNKIGHVGGKAFSDNKVSAGH
ncbi:hypothetical protein DXG01_009028 [Tephrocybe rancida]|nr:hypothetical protein DXG01_009028 [Tephrocybe rancida]